jgi:hypothetical protein
VRQIQRVTVLKNHPQRCCLCLSEKEDWFIDTGLDTTFDGTFYVCSRCVTKVVSLSPIHYTKEQMARLTNEYRVLKEEAEQKAEAACRKAERLEMQIITARKELEL